MRLAGLERPRVGILPVSARSDACFTRESSTCYIESDAGAPDTLIPVRVEKSQGRFPLSVPLPARDDRPRERAARVAARSLRTEVAMFARRALQAVRSTFFSPSPCPAPRRRVAV